MLNTQFKKKYYRVGYFNDEVPTYRFFDTRKQMIEFINTIGKVRTFEVVFIRELNIVEGEE